MKLFCAGASSKGNSFALQASDGSTLFLEAGCHFKEIEKQMNYNFDVAHNLLLISHFHGDHCKYVDEYLKRGIIARSNEAVHEKHKEVKVISTMETQVYPWMKGWVIGAFPVEHDVPDYGYIIKHPEMGTLVFFTDAYNVDYVFRKVDHWLIEANYDDKILNDNWINGRIQKFRRDRLMLSHFSIDNCITYLRQCQAWNSSNIVLTHLSNQNADPDLFKDRLEKAFGVPTYIAKKGLQIELNTSGL